MKEPPHDWRLGIKRIPLHLATFGLLGALATIYGGWGAAAALAAWRGYEEYLDWRESRDTFTKALIDFWSQAGPAFVAAVTILT